MQLVAVQTPAQVTERIEAEKARRIANGRVQYQQPEIVDALANKVRGDWQIAKSTKQVVTQRLVDCLERRSGEYSAQKRQEIAQTQGSGIYMQLTAAKCRAAKAYLSDLYTPSGDRPFTIKPTPIPELPPQIQQKLMAEAMAVLNQSQIEPAAVAQILEKHKERLIGELMHQAEKRAEKMADHVEDMLVEGKFRTEFDAFLDDLVTYPAAIIKGPVFANRAKIKWVEVQGQYAPQRSHEIVPEVRRVSPFDSYPSPGARAELGGHWHIEHRRFTFSELASMRGAPGYNTLAITRALHEYRQGGLHEWIWSEEEHRRLSGQNSVYGRRETIDALEWTGTMSGQMLVDWGMNPQSVPDLVNEYPVSVIVVGNFAIRALVNPDPAGKPDYFKACWENVPGSWWGRGLPEIMADCQDMCNGVARALANNLGLASGPQVWVNNAYAEDGADYQTIYPWKIWYFRTPTTNSGQQQKPMDFFQPNSHASELMEVYERFAKYADEVTGMPAFAYGSDSGAGAAKTASGLSMLLNASSKTIKSVVHNIDIHVIEPLVEKFYNHVMMTHPDNSIKGDAVAKARGSESLIHKEAAQARAQELLGILSNPVDQQIIGLDGRLELLKEVLNTGDMPVERILPSLEELAARLQPAPPEAGPGDKSEQQPQAAAA
ncbi:MAG: hypothetical protein CME59_22610 [Halioglobus sp.]|nr:hypothetical protein [Halioglobus sp.]|tara:strand:+ start:1562 stop:3541 length:1980 start_codon:yes stop_codon:yes gene_type:complete